MILRRFSIGPARAFPRGFPGSATAFVLGLVALVVTPGRSSVESPKGAVLRKDFPPEFLCDRDDLPVRIELTRAGVDSIGRSFSKYNHGTAIRADSLLRVGFFGPAGSDDAIRGAHRWFQLRSWNAMYTISNLTELRGGVSRMDGSGHFLPFIDRYRNAAMYPLRHVDVARVGEGSFCLRYEMPDDYVEDFTFGSQKIRVRAMGTTNADGKPLRVLSREWATGDGSKLELLFESSYTGRVHRETIVDRGDRLDLVVFYDIEGLYVRKHGTHRLSAMALWRNSLEGDEIPKTPRVGAAAYFPSIRIDLPWFLPDIGLHDLREFAYPPPLLAGDLVQTPGLLPEWLEYDDSGRIRSWDSLGPRPAVLDERFPDL